MTPWRQAQQWWAKNNHDDFFEVLAAHLDTGFVVSTPDNFVMAHDISWDGKEARADMPANGYFVTMAVGSGVGDLMRLAPEKKEYVAWRRNARCGQLKVYRWDNLARKAGI